MSLEEIIVPLSREQAQRSLTLITNQISIIDEAMRFGYHKIPVERQPDYFKTLKEDKEFYQALAGIYNIALDGK